MNQLEFRQRKSGFTGTNTMLIMGSILLVMGLLLISSQGNPTPLGTGILVICISLWNSSRVLVALRDDHLEMKIAPLSSQQLILYKEIQQITEEGKKTFLQTTQGKKVPLPLNLMEEDQAQTLVKELRKRISSGKRAS